MWINYRTLFKISVKPDVKSVPLLGRQSRGQSAPCSWAASPTASPPPAPGLPAPRLVHPAPGPPVPQPVRLAPGPPVPRTVRLAPGPPVPRPVCLNPGPPVPRPIRPASGPLVLSVPASPQGPVPVPGELLDPVLARRRLPSTYPVWMFGPHPCSALLRPPSTHPAQRRVTLRACFFFLVFFGDFGMSGSCPLQGGGL